jgi:DNA replication protein DnaC
MNQPTQALEHASVRQYCKGLRIPVIGSNFVRLSEQAVKEQRSHIGYLEALLAMEAEERDRHAVQKRIREAKLPRLKTLEEFDFNQARQIPAAKIRELSEGRYIERAEPVALRGECGTGKTHLATGLCVAACRQKRRDRLWARQQWRRTDRVGQASCVTLFGGRVPADDQGWHPQADYNP